MSDIGGENTTGRINMIELKDLLGEKHEGMKVSTEGLLGRIISGRKPDKGQRYMISQLLKHLQETGKRFYAGDVKVIDEFLQLYCLDENRPD